MAWSELAEHGISKGDIVPDVAGGLITPLRGPLVRSTTWLKGEDTRGAAWAVAKEFVVARIGSSVRPGTIEGAVALEMEEDTSIALSSNKCRGREMVACLCNPPHLKWHITSKFSDTKFSGSIDVPFIRR